MPNAYYCFVAGFPDFCLDDPKLPINLKGLRSDLAEQLAAEDRIHLAELFYPIDNKNFLAVLLAAGAKGHGDARPEQAHDALGNFTREEIEEEIRVPLIIPKYMVEFLEVYRAGLSAGTLPENVLAELMYDHLSKSKNAFIREWFAFDRDIRNITVALGSRRMGSDPERGIVGEGLVADAAARASGADFGLSRELTWLEPLLRGYHSGLLDRELLIDKIRLDMLEELTLKSSFSLDRVLALVTRLSIAERWPGLDGTRGRALLSRVLSDMESELVFPDEFSIRGGRKHGDNR